MTDDLARVALGLPICVVWPRAIPALRGSVAARAAASALSAAYVLAPRLGTPSAWLLVGAIVVLAWALPATVRDGAATATPIAQIPAALVAALGIGTAAALSIDAGGSWSAVRDVTRDAAVAYVVIGALAATFVAGSATGWALQPIAGRLGQRPPGFVDAGRYIGWLERALVFGFIVAGEPAAAALALTAKSVARFPAFAANDEPLAEYVLIGTLLSFLAAVLVAVAVRAALGLPAM